jgi:hypothetical protein
VVAGEDDIRDAEWLARAWGALGEYEGRWIGIVNADVWDSDTLLERLGDRARETVVDPLFAFVTFERIA